jgi:uncharacterized coiled-coil protein SlyX
MERVLETLNELFDHLSTGGDLIQKYDALLLTSIDLSEPQNHSAPSLTSAGSGGGIVAIGEGIGGIKAIGDRKVVRLNGLNKISSEIIDILNFGIIHQQILLSKLRNEFNETCQLFEEMKEKYSEESQVKEWETLPPASGSSSGSGNPFSEIDTHEKSSTIALLKKEFHPKFQRLFNDAYSLMQTKTKAFELVDGILARYTGAPSISSSCVTSSL